MDISRAFIALGGNLGNVKACFQQARLSIDSLANVRVIDSSLLYRTPPLGPEGQPDYLNAVIAVETSMIPHLLLEALQGIERVSGRIRGEHWGARTLDLDIISFNNMQIESETLVLPHPEMHRRQFVLRPLCDLAPNWQHPRLGESARMLLANILQTGEMPLAEGITW